MCLRLSLPIADHGMVMRHDSDSERERVTRRLYTTDAVKLGQPILQAFDGTEALIRVLSKGELLLKYFSPP